MESVQTFPDQDLPHKNNPNYQWYQDFVAVHRQTGMLYIREGHQMILVGKSQSKDPEIALRSYIEHQRRKTEQRMRNPSSKKR